MCCLCSWHGSMSSLHSSLSLSPSVYVSAVPNVSRRCERTPWDNQYVWIWFEPPRRGLSLCLLVSHIWTPPCSVSYKSATVREVRWSLRNFHPRGLNCQPGPDQLQHLHRLWSLQTAHRNKQRNKDGSFWEIHGDDALQTEEMPWWVAFSLISFIAAHHHKDLNKYEIMHSAS